MWPLTIWKRNCFFPLLFRCGNKNELKSPALKHFLFFSILYFLVLALLVKTQQNLRAVTVISALSIPVIHLTTATCDPSAVISLTS